MKRGNPGTFTSIWAGGPWSAIEDTGASCAARHRGFGIMIAQDGALEYSVNLFKSIHVPFRQSQQNHGHGLLLTL